MTASGVVLLAGGGVHPEILVLAILGPGGVLAVEWALDFLNL